MQASKQATKSASTELVDIFATFAKSAKVTKQAKSEPYITLQKNGEKWALVLHNGDKVPEPIVKALCSSAPSKRNRCDFIALYQILSNGKASELLEKYIDTSEVVALHNASKYLIFCKQVLNLALYSAEKNPSQKLLYSAIAEQVQSEIKELEKALNATPSK